MADHAGALAPPRRRVALLRGRRGVTTVVFALSLTALLGALGVGTEAAFWYEDWVQVQGVADAAALSGAISISVPAEQQSSTAGPAATMTYVAGQNGYVNGTGGVTVTPHYPPADGSYASNEYAAEITISKQETLHIARLFMSVGPTITAKAVGLYKSNSPACVMTLGNDTSSTNNGELYMSGGGKLNASGCTVASNNAGAHSIELDPSAKVNAYTMQAEGTIASTCGQGPTGCGNTLTLTRPYTSNSVASTDPLASVQSVPLPSSSTFPTSCTTSIPSGTASISPGTYCTMTLGGSTTNLTMAAGTYYIDGGINICTSGCNIPTSPAISIASTSSGSTFYINGSVNIEGSTSAVLNLAPGTYFIYNGSLNVTASGGVTCTSCVAGGAGVTFVLMGNNPGTVNVSGASPVTFSAPASSNYSSGLDGVAIYEPVSDTGTNSFTGSGSVNLQGAIYTPGAFLDISGGAGTSSATCSWFIANTISLTGSGTATNSDCASYGYSWGSSKGTIALVQ